MTIPQARWKTVSEVVTCRVSFLKRLASGELLRTPLTVVEVGTNDLTLGNKAINSGTITINEVSRAASQAVQFSVTGGLASVGRYKIRITVTTDASPQNHTLIETLFLDVKED